jgi:hypothetical protein
MRSATSAWVKLSALDPLRQQRQWIDSCDHAKRRFVSHDPEQRGTELADSGGIGPKLGHPARNSGFGSEFEGLRALAARCAAQKSPSLRQRD